MTMSALSSEVPRITNTAIPPCKPALAPRRKRVMLVDDDEVSSQRLSSTLIDMGFDVVQAWGAEQAVTMFRSLFHVIDMVLLNLEMSGQDSLGAFEWMKHIDPNARVLLLTEGLFRDTRVEAAIERGALGAMSKRSGAVKLAIELDGFTPGFYEED